LTAHAFIQRFLLHFLPPGFVRIPAPCAQQPLTGARYAVAERRPGAKRWRRGGRKGVLFFLSAA
jgi:hypothetical protein